MAKAGQSVLAMRKGPTAHWHLSLGEASIALLPTCLALAWLISKAQWFWNNRSELRFGWIVLALSVLMFSERWRTAPPTVFRWTRPALFFAVAGFTSVILAQLYSGSFSTGSAVLAALALGVLLVSAANFHQVFGWAGVRHFAFPFLFLLLALPIPEMFYRPLVLGLQAGVASVAVECLELCGVPAQKIGSLVQLPNCTVGIDEACSGVRSLQSTVMAALFIGSELLRSRLTRVFLLAAAVILAVFGNLLRAFFLAWTASRGGLKALHRYHDSAAWSILLFTAIGTIFLARAIAKFDRTYAAATNRLLDGNVQPSPQSLPISYD